MESFLEKNLKKIIIVFILIIIIIVTAFIILKFQQKNEIITEQQESASYNIVLSKMRQEIDYRTYFTINNCIGEYYKNITNLNNYQNNSKIKKAERLLKLFNKEYINKFNLDVNTVIEKFSNYNYNNFIIENIYYTDNDNVTTTYLVLGKQINENSDISEQFGFVVLMDDSNKTYSIAPYEFIKQLELKEGFDISDLIDTSNIEKSVDYANTFSYEDLTEEETIQKLFYLFKLACKYDSSYAYSLLDDNYRNAHFQDEKSAKKYLENIIDKVLGEKIEKYSKDTSDINYNNYLCFDNLNNIFILKKNSYIVDFTVMLDLYTIPYKQFETVYNKANESKKTAYCIEFFKEMINLKDYTAAYNVLDKTFASNNFDSPESLEKYINSNWYEFINISFDKYEKINDIGTVSVSIKNRDNVNSNSISKTFIIKLNNDDTYTMSFNVD